MHNISQHDHRLRIVIQQFNPIFPIHFALGILLRLSLLKLGPSMALKTGEASIICFDETSR